MNFKAFFGTAVLLLSGCAVVPDAIQVADEAQLINYQQAAAAPVASQDKTARWGGVIAEIENLPDATLLEMVHYPLRAYGKPLVSDESIGRFRVYVDGFLDPMVYEKGRSITFTGKVLGTEEGLVGEHNYVFPTLKADGYHLWRNVQQIDVTTLHVWPYYRHHGYGWPYGGYYRHRVILRDGHKRGTSSAPVNDKPSRPPSNEGSLNPVK